MSRYAAPRSDFDIQKHEWLRANRGVLKRIALRTSFSQGYISDIFHGRRRSYTGEVERLLTEAGAPGWGGTKE